MEKKRDPGGSGARDSMDRMRALVEALCSPRCAGRAPGTPGGLAARQEITAALRGAGLDPFEQPVPGCGGANVIARLPGEIDRWILLAAHHDHLGQRGRQVYWGADDNAAAVGILVELAHRLTARRPRGRGVLLVTFDGEEPPYFLSEAMGSEYFARHPVVPLAQIDQMVCMDLVGHSLGGAGTPAEVAQSLFVLGAERSAGTSERLRALVRAEPGVILRPLDAEAIPPLSDYQPFWTRSVPFLFLSAGRSRRYHTPEDRPDGLAWAKMMATAAWLERLVRQLCADSEAPTRFLAQGRDDAATLRTMHELLTALAVPAALVHEPVIAELRRSCDAQGRLPDALRFKASLLLESLEQALR